MIDSSDWNISYGYGFNSHKSSDSAKLYDKQGLEASVLAKNI